MEEIGRHIRLYKSIIKQLIVDSKIPTYQLEIYEDLTNDFDYFVFICEMAEVDHEPILNEIKSNLAKNGYIVKI